MVNRDNPRVLVPPPLIFGALLSLGLFLQREPPFAFGLLEIASVLVGLTGLALIATALGLFQKNNTRPEPWQPSSALVCTGVYRFTRNPMYLGMAMVCLSIAVGFSSMAAGLLTFLAVAIIDRTVIAREEAYLTRRFGKEYGAYRQRVRRWL